MENDDRKWMEAYYGLPLKELLPPPQNEIGWLCFTLEPAAIVINKRALIKLELSTEKALVPAISCSSVAEGQPVGKLRLENWRP